MGLVNTNPNDRGKYNYNLYFRAHEKIEYLIWNEERAVIENSTGCLPPCSY